MVYAISNINNRFWANAFITFKHRFRMWSSISNRLGANNRCVNDRWPDSGDYFGKYIFKLDCLDAACIQYKFCVTYILWKLRSRMFFGGWINGIFFCKIGFKEEKNVEWTKVINKRIINKWYCNMIFYVWIIYLPFWL